MFDNILLAFAHNLSYSICSHIFSYFLIYFIFDCYVYINILWTYNSHSTLHIPFCNLQSQNSYKYYVHNHFINFYYSFVFLVTFLYCELQFANQNNMFIFLAEKNYCNFSQITWGQCERFDSIHSVHTFSVQFLLFIIKYFIFVSFYFLTIFFVNLNTHYEFCIFSHFPRGIQIIGKYFLFRFKQTLEQTKKK